MKIFSSIAILVFVLSATGCMHLPKSFKKADNYLVHQPTNSRFPREVGKFFVDPERPYIRFYQATEDDDVSVGYKYIPILKAMGNRPYAAQATVYSYAADKPADTEYNDSKKGILENHRSPKLLEEKTEKLSISGKPVELKQAVYEVEDLVFWAQSVYGINQGKVMPVVTRLGFMQVGKRFLKFRISYPKEDADDYKNLADEFIPTYLKFYP